MRKLVISTFVSLAWIVPALAQDAPQGQSVAPNSAQRQDQTVIPDVQSIERNVQAHLAVAGFTDIQMVPTSFLVRAKDADGNTVMLVLSPDSVAELQDLVPGDASGQGSNPNSDATSRPPSTTLPDGYDNQ